MAVQIRERPSGGVGVSLGPLRPAASPGEIWTRLPGSPGLGDFEVRPRRGWNMGLAVQPETIAAVAMVSASRGRLAALGTHHRRTALRAGRRAAADLAAGPSGPWLATGRRRRAFTAAARAGVCEPDVYGPLVYYDSTRIRYAELPNAEPYRLGQLRLDHAPE